MRHTFLLMLFLLCLTLLARTVLADSNRPLAGSRPNIILMMPDDQGMGDLSCMGNPDLKTPCLDRLYGLSTRLTDFHVSPTCAPTRSAILCGRHEFRNGVTHTILERERMTLDAMTLPQLLKSAGYTTGIFGKWHLGDGEPYQPQNRGFDEVFIHGAGGIGQNYPCSCADAPPNRERKYFDPAISHNGRFVQTRGFCTDVFFQEALRWIREQNAAEKPFFAYITPNAPHGPMYAPDRHKQPFLDAGFDENTAARYGMIANIDENIGLLMEKMSQWGLDDNTLLIFITDNGQASRGGRRNGKRVRLFTAGFKTGKGSPYEGGTHVPAFWRWRGVLDEGADIDTLSGHIDLLPTLCEIAGAELPGNLQKLDGRSLVELLEDNDAPASDRYLFTHVGRWPKGADPNDSKYTRFAVRNERFRWVNGNELYDIENDPYEATNVIDDHPEVVTAMREAYDAWWAETLPLMVNEDVPNSAHQPYVERYNEQQATEGIPAWTPPEL